MKSTFWLGLALAVSGACASIPGAQGWETASLKQQAATDLGCGEEALSLYESRDKLYSVRGCGKRARYTRQSCDRVNRVCVFTRSGDVIADQSAAVESSGNPGEVTITPR
jgi:hypothetical protein